MFEYLKKKGIYVDHFQYVSTLDWNDLISISPVINDAFYYLRLFDKTKYSILTKVCSNNEGQAKIKKLKYEKVELPVIIVPFRNKKTDYVNPVDNILVDNEVHNLDDFTYYGGQGIYFSEDFNNIDSWGDINKNYPVINTLEKCKILTR